MLSLSDRFCIWLAIKDGSAGDKGGILNGIEKLKGTFKVGEDRIIESALKVYFKAVADHKWKGGVMGRGGKSNSKLNRMVYKDIKINNLLTAIIMSKWTRLSIREVLKQSLLLFIKEMEIFYRDYEIGGLSSEEIKKKFYNSRNDEFNPYSGFETVPHTFINYNGRLCRMVDCSLLSYRRSGKWIFVDTSPVDFNGKKILKRVNTYEYRSGRWYKVKVRNQDRYVYVYFIIDYRAKYCYVFDVRSKEVECGVDAVFDTYNESNDIMNVLIDLKFDGIKHKEYCIDRQFYIEKMHTIEAGMRRYKRLNFNSYVNRLNQSIDENILDHIVD